MIVVLDVTTFQMFQVKSDISPSELCEVYDIYHIGFSGGWEGECSALELRQKGGFLLVVLMSCNTCSRYDFSYMNRLQACHTTLESSSSEPCAVF